MARGRFTRLHAALLAFVLALGASTAARQAAPATSSAPSVRAALPDRLTDAEFWKLATDISEPGGYFQITDNFTSNEGEVGQVFTMLRETGVRGGVYMGVGPEQNFSYIASIRPQMAFILDIRRQAAMQHLMFKAAFELSKDRADFLSLLFAKPRPASVDASAPIQALWDVYIPIATDAALATRNHTLIVDQLTRNNRFTFSTDEREKLDHVIRSFVLYGPAISTRGTVQGRGGGNNLTFADLTGWATDASGQPMTFLSTEEHFRTVKALHDKNLIVPVTGDFGGPKALRAVGAWVKARGGVVSAFYLSNVEQYLFQDGKQQTFYDNVATLPLTDRSVFIRPYSLRRGGGTPQSLCAIQPFLTAVNEGRVLSNNAALTCPR